MAEQYFSIRVEAEDARSAEQGARSLADELRQLPGVVESDRRKDDQSTMDLGAILTVIAMSPAVAAIARGIVDWLRRRRETRLTIEKDPRSDSIKLVIEKIDPTIALRIAELIREN